MKVWTDYPFRESDIPGREAPVRKVRVISYDGDKYVKIRWRGEIADIKFGYIYPRSMRWRLGVRVNPRVYPLG